MRIRVIHPRAVLNEYDHKRNGHFYAYVAFWGQGGMVPEFIEEEPLLGLLAEPIWELKAKDGLKWRCEKSVLLRCLVERGQFELAEEIKSYLGNEVVVVYDQENFK